MSVPRQASGSPVHSATGAWEMLVRLRGRSDLLRRIEKAHRTGTQSSLKLQQELRKTEPEALVRAALHLSDLRRRGAEKFSRASAMWFDRVGLEQATAEPVARWKAGRFAERTPDDAVLHDLCSGLGGDAAALAEIRPVRMIERDPLTLTRALWNVAAYKPSHPVTGQVANVLGLGLRNAWLHLDPDRRALPAQRTGGAKRSVRIEEMTPDPDAMRRLIADNHGGAIKLSPASNFGGKFDNAEIELISLGGECKEATVWFGRLAGAEPYRATSLPTGESLAGDPLASYPEVRSPGAYLFDPDPAIVRAGLVDLLCERCDLGRLDDAEEYLTGDTIPQTAFVTPFRIVETLSYRTPDLKKFFRKADYGQLEIKCRHLSVDVNALRKKLPLKGSRSGTLVLAKLEGKATGLLVERC